MENAEQSIPVKKVCLSVEEARKSIGIGRELFYSEMNKGLIRSFKIGHRRFITHAALEEYIQKLDAGEDSAA